MCTGMKTSNEKKMLALCQGLQEQAKKDACSEKVPALVAARFDSCLHVGQASRPVQASHEPRGELAQRTN